VPDLMNCPKCGRRVEVGTFICPGCEYILDTSFLGEDITDDERDRRDNAPVPSAMKVKTVERAVDFGEDAIILGNGQGDYSDFSSRDAGLTREPTHARFYIGGNTAAILDVDCVPEPVPGIVEGNLKMSPFERHVLGFINGKRSIGRIQKKSAMEDSEFKTAVAMLADKGIIRQRTTKKRKALDGGPLSASEVSRISAGPAPSTARPAADPPARSGWSQHADAASRGLSPPSPSSSPLAAARAADASPGASRTVVAIADELSEERAQAEANMKAVAAAAAALEGAIPTRAQVRGSRASPAEPTIIKSEGKSSRNASGPDFASVRIQEAALPRAQDDGERPNEWDEGPTGGNDNNISSIFARARASPEPVSGLKSRTPSVANSILFGDADDAREHVTDERKASAPTTVRPGGDTADEPYSIDDGDIIDLPDALRDPTGIGDSRVDDQMSGGNPLSGSAPDVVRTNDHGDSADFNVAETAVRFRGRPIDLERDEGRTAGISARPHTDDAPTGPLPDRDADDDIDADDDDHVFDVETAASVSGRDAVEVSDIPVIVETPVPTPAPPPPAPRPAQAILPLPGQSLPAPAPATQPTALPGQPSMAHKGAAPRNSTPAPAVSAPPAAAAPGAGGMRASAGSTGPFEQRRKAEKIFEQAVKDHAAGRISSARMNAKLAVMYDGSVDAYRAFLADLDVMGAAAAPPRAGKPKELKLFEQASDAESRGDYQAAVALLEEAVAINPKAAALRNRLGVVMSVRLKRHTEALEHLRVAIEREPGNVVYMNNFSKVTALLESQLEKAPNAKRGKIAAAEKIQIKTMRPKSF
jgi:hypothetical protein